MIASAWEIGALSAHQQWRCCLAVEEGYFMLLALFVVLLVMWLLGFAAFHVAGGLIHLLLILAVIALIVHLFRGRSAV
jgi:hypothetical protein